MPTATMTHMAMSKTQVYLPAEDLKQLKRIARKKKRRIADLVREAVQKTWLQRSSIGPVALYDGPVEGVPSLDHDGAFDE